MQPRKRMVIENDIEDEDDYEPEQRDAPSAVSTWVGDKYGEIRDTEESWLDGKRKAQDAKTKRKDAALIKKRNKKIANGENNDV